MLRAGLISLILILFISVGAAQEVTNKAIRHYQNQELQKAKRLIDSAITIEGEKEDPYTWQARGFIYKDLFKKSEGNTREENRKEAIEAYRSSLEREPEEKVKKACRKGLNYMANSSFNDAMKRLDTNRIERPVELFELYLSIMEDLGKGDGELKEDKIQFYNRLGSTYMALYEGERGHDEEDFQNAIDAFGKVLANDSSNYLANYNTGILYYNRGVQIAQEVNPGKMEVELKKMKELQKKSAEFFQKALPYMKKAHQQKPERIETLEGLAGIYYSLHEDEKSEKYKKKKQEILQEGNR